jgi:pimeloyl-ACP methyl ester carboxylesterase
MAQDHQTSPWEGSEPSSDARNGNNGAWIAAGATAAALAGAALFNHWRAAVAEEEAPPPGEFVEIDGVRLHYVDRGSGQPVLLLHGNGVMLQDWEASGVMGLAADRYRVIAVDRPGFGYTERPRTTVWTPAAQAELIHRAVRELGIERPIVVGHSWGTLVALAMALNHPDDVAGLVLLSGYYYGTVRPDVPIFSPPAVPVVGDALAYTVSPLAGRLLLPALIKASFAPAPVSERFAMVPKGLMLRPFQIRATSADTAMMIPAAIELSERYAELDLPVTILAAAGDLIAHIDEHAEKLAAAVDNAQLRTVSEAGHMLHYTSPAAVVDAIDGVAARAFSQPATSADARSAA